MSFLTQLDPASGARLEKLMQQHLLGPGTSLKACRQQGGLHGCLLLLLGMLQSTPRRACCRRFWCRCC